MIEKIIEYSVRNRFQILAATAALAVWGVFAVYNTPIDAIPDLSENQLIVFTDWMGHSPQEIEDQVTYPLASQLQGLAGVKAVRSSSEFNFSMINVIFDEKTGFYFARQRVLERLDNIKDVLPAGVVPYLAPDATATGQIFWYTVEGAGYDLSELRSIQDWFIRYQLSGVPGVAEVASIGGYPREYQIDIDPDKLRAYGVTLGQVESAVANSNQSVGGRVVDKGNAEYIIRSVGWIKSIKDIEDTAVTQRDGVPIFIKNVAHVQLGTAFRRGVLEKDGKQAVGGVVLMRFGENPRTVTERIKAKIEKLQSGLPAGVRIVPFYDRTPLIDGAVHTVTGVLKEAMLTATIMILLILGHIGGAVVICLTLPLAVLFSFILMYQLGVPSNIMSLSGLAISIGVLVDSSIVMVENASHRLAHKFGDARVKGDTRDEIIAACKTVGRPIFFSILIMLVSFIPVFALSGMEGKMFRPLAWTKTLALVGVSIFAITLVPALLPTFLRGRMKREDENWIIRGFINVYRPMLDWLMDRPVLVIWTFVCILGTGWLLAGKLGGEFMPPLDEGTVMDMATSVPRASIAETIEDLKKRDALLRSFPEVSYVVGKSGRAETPTDPAPLEMFETIVQFEPRDRWPKRQLRYEDALRETNEIIDQYIAAGIVAKPADDLRKQMANDVAMEGTSAVDKTLRTLASDQLTKYQTFLGLQLTRDSVDSLVRILTRQHSLNKPPGHLDDVVERMSAKYGARLAEQPLVYDAEALSRDVVANLVDQKIMNDDPRLLTLQPNALQTITWEAGELVGRQRPTLFSVIYDDVVKRRNELLAKRVAKLNWELFDRAVVTFDATVTDKLLVAAANTPNWAVYIPFLMSPIGAMVSAADVPKLLQRPPTDTEIAAMRKELDSSFGKRLLLWRKSNKELLAEMDSVLRMPGWGNIWTKPIQNRVDMLATGARTMVVAKIFGDNLDRLQEVSQEVADVIRGVDGAVDVTPDQNVGKPYIEIEIDREKAARYGINVGDIQKTIEVALGGEPLTMTVEGRERFPVRVRYARDFRADEESIRRLLVTARGEMAGPSGQAMGGSMDSEKQKSASSPPVQIPLAEVANVRVVEGPASIRSEGGLLRSYVQCNVRGRDIMGFVEDAKQAVAKKVALPAGMYIEWGGQYEHQVRARRTLTLIFPLVLLAILFILYTTYRDMGDTLLMMLAVPGALAGGVIFQYLFGYNFSVAVWVGYIACFGMATETGVVMLVYLREAIDNRGGLANIRSIAELREAIMTGAVHRLRPKVLTEATTIIGIAPMLWATGVGAEVIRPMAAPVLGGLLIADEVIDIFLPVLFFWIRKRRWEKLQQQAGPRQVVEIDSEQSAKADEMQKAG